MITNILNLYRKHNLISVDNQLLSGTRMDYCCAKCNECWEGIEEFKADWNEIFLPHVGSSYVNNRIAVFGMNPHQYGGLYEFQRITAEAAVHIKDHNHKIHWGAEGYKGSMVFYRSAIYAALVDRALNGKLVDNIDDISYDELADVFDKITYSNTVKCSPNYEGSNPTKAMFNNCPQHILKKELDILKPTHIVVLGQDAASALVQGLNLKFIRSYDNSHLYKGEDLTVFEAPHPASRISNENRFKGFIEMVKDYQN